MRDPKKAGRWPLAAAAVLLAGIWIIDLALPLGVAVGMLYAIPVWVCMWVPGRRVLLVPAAAATALVVLGFFVSFSSVQVPMWITVTNRAMSVLVIWAVAALGLRLQGAWAAAQDAGEKRYRETINTLADALVVTNDQGLIIDINTQTAKMFGYQRDEILNKPVELLMPERYKEKHMRHRAGYYIRPRPMSTVMSTGMGMFGRHKDGSEFPIDATLSPMETPSGLLVLAAVRDMTEQKQLQAQLMQADRLAAVGSVVSGIAHEVNNPLAGALGRADLVLRGNLDDALKADVEVIRSEVWRAALTVRQFLTFAREHKPEKSNTSINETLEATLALRTYELAASNVQVVKDLQPDLPTTLADRNQLQQVFLNIILNAEQAMILAHGRGTLSLRTRQEGGSIVVTIADDGPGISLEHLPRVFDPFFTTKPDGKGTGLGLSVSHGIIQEHGGTIRVASEVGKGATFTVVLPAATNELLSRSP